MRASRSFNCSLRSALHKYHNETAASNKLGTPIARPSMREVLPSTLRPGVDLFVADNVTVELEPRADSVEATVVVRVSVDSVEVSPPIGLFVGFITAVVSWVDNTLEVVSVVRPITQSATFIISDTSCGSARSISDTGRSGGWLCRHRDFMCNCKCRRTEAVCVRRY